MANAKVLLALLALLGFSLSLPAQITWQMDDFIVGDVGIPGDGINDHAAFIRAQHEIQQYFDAGGPGVTGTLQLSAGEYIIGNQVFPGDPSIPATPTEQQLFNWNNHGLPGGVAVQCLSMVWMQDGFRLNDVSHFTVQGHVNGTSIRYRDCLYYGTFFRPQLDEIFSAVGDPCETCDEDPHSPDLLHAAVGAMFTFSDCDDITIRDIELNGNQDNAILGGTPFWDGYQSGYDGIALEYVSNSSIENVNAHHFGRDGLLLWGHEAHVPDNTVLPTDPADIGMPWAPTVLFDNTIHNSKFNWNGRQGISWTACALLTVTDCEMNYNAQGRVSSSLRAGLDIEGRGGPYRVRYGTFTNCDFLHNAGRGIHADTGPCIGQQYFDFIDCTVKAGGPQGLAVLPNSGGMTFTNCDIYGNVGPFYERVYNMVTDPALDLRFEDTDFYEEDGEYRYINWWSQNYPNCVAGPHMFQFTENRAGPVHFTRCTFNTNCHAIVRFYGPNVEKTSGLPWCQTCPTCDTQPSQCVNGDWWNTCLWSGGCHVDCVQANRNIILTDCTFTNAGREKCGPSTNVIGIARTTIVDGDDPDGFGLVIEMPENVRPPSIATDIYSTSFGPGCPTCDDPLLVDVVQDPISEYPTCLPLYEPPHYTWVSCVDQNLWTQACTEGGCVADLMIPDGTLSSTLSSTVSGTVSIQGQFIVDEDFTFDDAEVKMAPAAEIIVQPGINFYLINSTIESCLGMMWKSITANEGSVVVVKASRIADAENAIIGLSSSVILLNSAEFANNRVGVSVPDQGQFNSVSIYATHSTFHTAGPMASPYPGQPTTLGPRGYAALDVHDMALDFTGGNNTIHDLGNGIVATRSDVTVSGCTFNDIQTQAAYDDELVGNGAAINAYGGKRGWYWLQQEGPGMTEAPNFERCRWGIHTMYMHVLSQDNNMQEMGTGYRIMRSGNRNVEVLDNQVHALGTGMDFLVNDGAAYLVVQDNKITFGDDPGCGVNCQGASGINVSEGGMPATWSRIQNNTIHYAASMASRTGINLLAAHGWVVADNQLDMVHNTHNSYGVQLNGCKGTEVSCNTISSATNNWSNDRQAAIRNIMGADLLISCNDMNETTHGLLFNGVVTNDAEVRGNKIRRHRRGLYLSPNAMIGGQHVKGNLWLAAYPSGTWGARYEDEEDAENFPFRYNPDDNPNTEPPSVFPAEGWFVEWTLEPNYNCADDEGEDYCGQFQVEGGGKHLTELDARVANDEIENDPYTAESRWMLQGGLYAKLDDHPDLLDEAPEFESFYDDLAGSAIASFKGVDDAQRALYGLNPSVAEQLHMNQQQAEVVLVLMQAVLEQLDDTDLTPTQRAALLATISEYHQTLTTLQAYNTTAMDLASTTKALTAESVQNANAAIGTSEAIEQNQKAVNEIYLTAIGKDVDSFTPEQATALFGIANQCPMIGGNAVFKARSLYALIDDTQEFDDVLLCLPHGIIVKSLFEQDINNVSVVPNPTNDQATLVLTEALNAPASLVLFNNVGQEIARHGIPVDITHHAFSTLGVTSGLYHYKVVSFDGLTLIGEGKLGIMR